MERGLGLVISVGRWGGINVQHNRTFWRVCLGWVSVILTLHGADQALTVVYQDLIERRAARMLQKQITRILDTLDRYEETGQIGRLAYARRMLRWLVRRHPEAVSAWLTTVPEGDYPTVVEARQTRERLAGQLEWTPAEGAQDLAALQTLMDAFDQATTTPAAIRSFLARLR